MQIPGSPVSEVVYLGPSDSGVYPYYGSHSLRDHQNSQSTAEHSPIPPQALPTSACEKLYYPSLAPSLSGVGLISDVSSLGLEVCRKPRSWFSHKLLFLILQISL